MQAGGCGDLEAAVGAAADQDFDFPDSNWIKEVRPEHQHEFFDSRGFQKCPNGNVDLVKALMAGRPILRD